MTHSTRSTGVFLLGLVLGATLVSVFRLLEPDDSSVSVWAEERPRDLDPIWVERVGLLEGKLPGQSHAMMDVAYHFANLWFAAQAENWPLADFYLRETLSHLKWAVRIIPIRKDPEGNDVDLGGILESIETTHFVWMSDAIAKKEKVRFDEVYRLTVEACHACHKASGKPYLRPQMPEAPPEKMIRFSPDAEWPK
ncbi:MAG: hypothetical protein GHCLOJNM_01528 [bacterium]|nr:hypothetical protein [bacterium]